MLTKKANITVNKNRLNEKFPNENLFKSDNKYHLNKDLQFDSQIENQNFSHDIFRRKQDLLKFALLFFLLKFCISFSFRSYSMFFLTLMQIICLIIIFLFTSNLNSIMNSSNYCEIEKSLKHLRILYEVHSIIYIYQSFNYKIEINESTSLTYDIAFNHFFFTSISNFLTNTTFYHGFLLHVLKGLLLLSFTSHSDMHFFSRGFRNLFSYDFIVIILLILAMIGMESLFNRNFAELWGLYDSFKRSFYIFKRCLYDDFPNPIFILSRKQYEIVLYKNKAADSLHEKITVSKMNLKNSTNNNGNNNPSNFSNVNQNGTSTNTTSAGLNKKTMAQIASGNSSFNKKNALANRKSATNNHNKNFTFSNIFEKEFEQLFITNIDKCVSNKKKFFYFPFPPYDKPLASLRFKESIRNITFFEGDMESFEWYKIIVCPCTFKSQEAILLQMLREDGFYKEEFLTNFFTNINNEFNVLIEDVDKICDNIVEADYFFDRREKLQIISKVNTNNPNNKEGFSKNLGERLNESYKEKNDLLRSNRLKTLNLVNDNNKAKITKDLLIDLHNVQYPYLDYSVWFFFKSNSNTLYDSFLSMKIYNHLNSKKFLRPNYKITNLSNLIKYFDDMFFTASQNNNITIISNIHGNILNFNSLNNTNCNNITPNGEDEYIIVYEYLRVVIFNIYLFNLNNTTDHSKFREFDINYFIEKIPKCKNTEYDICLRIETSIEEDNPIINFNDLNLILQKYNPIGNPKNENDFAVNVDPRILIIYLITKVYYQTEFNCKREDNLSKLSVSILMQTKDFQKKSQENLKLNLTSSSNITNCSSVSTSNPNIRINNITNGILNPNFFNYKNIKEKYFEEPKFYISEPYYVKLLKNTYGCEIDYKPNYKIIHNKYEASYSDEIINEIISSVASEDEEELFEISDLENNPDFQLSKIF